VLKSLVIVNVCASGAHFLHNAVFLASYPGPHWISNAWMVIASWFVVVGVLVVGYLWHRKGHLRRATVAFSFYCLSCFLVFGHYLYGAPSHFDALTNVLIFGEGLAGAALLIYFLGWASRRPPGAAV